MKSPHNVISRCWTSRVLRLAAMSVVAVLLWSCVFHETFVYPLAWDDLHFIRSYSLRELASTFYGPNDVDLLETPALRPVATALFCLQGVAFGDNPILHRIFMVLLMTGLLFALGLLLTEAGLSVRHVAVVFVLFASSRVFTSLLLWITLGSLIASYAFVALTGFFFMRWIGAGRKAFAALAIAFATLAVFSREEAYTLPVVLLILWRISRYGHRRPHRAIALAAGIAAVMAIHFAMRAFFVPDAPPINFSVAGARSVAVAALSATMPGGYQVKGVADGALALLWLTFVALIGIRFLRYATKQRMMEAFSACAVGIILCAPALGVSRPFGIAMPAFAFFTAAAIVMLDIQRRLRNAPPDNNDSTAKAGHVVLALGLAIGATAGLVRSSHVADDLHPYSARAVLRDAEFLYLDMDERQVTIPEPRRTAGLARLERLGVRSRADAEALLNSILHNPSHFQLRHGNKEELFLAKYDYMSW